MIVYVKKTHSNIKFWYGCNTFFFKDLETGSFKNNFKQKGWTSVKEDIQETSHFNPNRRFCSPIKFTITSTIEFLASPFNDNVGYWLKLNKHRTKLTSLFSLSLCRPWMFYMSNTNYQFQSRGETAEHWRDYEASWVIW